MAKINNNDELLLAWTFIPNLESTNQLARTIGVNPINALNKSSKGNQFQEASQSNPNAETNSPNFLSCKEHDFTRQPKKKARGLGWIEARIRSKLLKQTSQELVNDFFQQVMIILNYLVARNRY